VAGARVELIRANRVVASTTTDSGGHFLMNVASGSYRITAHNVGYGSQASRSISVSGPVTVRLVVDSGLR
jgi:hypothetical protein